MKRNESDPAKSTEELDVFDRTASLDYVDHDVEFLQELLAMLMEHRAAIMEQIATAIDNNDPERLCEASHRMKGMLRTFHSIHAAETAGKLELNGKTGSVESAAGLYTRLDRQIDELCNAVQAFIGELQ